MVSKYQPLHVNNSALKCGRIAALRHIAGEIRLNNSDLNLEIC
ncbi:protein of unknown function [Vibrio tapetis subsp. tapetis]|uniref:Uncharacterized protein n=1 Tax=Vibrio tapetis subsp. tapetis TaxID=1671868 RepID=A0A2N8ZM95_9VIBR|nr:protein of unknown function [Vibrio tapetis subsp. tapetis]